MSLNSRLIALELIIPQCFSIPVSVFSLESLNYGLGLHQWDQRPEWYEKYSKVIESHCNIPSRFSLISYKTDGLCCGYLVSNLMLAHKDLAMSYIPAPLSLPS